MKTVVAAIILFCISSCDSNPLGKTKISSCDHSPNFKTGLPITCQVNLTNIENIKIWLDANDSGTITSPNQTDVEIWKDKSGNSTDFASVSNRASLIKKQVNNRTAIRWNTSSTEYISSVLDGFNQNQSLTVAISFKTSPSVDNKFKLTNGPGNGFELVITQKSRLRISLGTTETYLSSIPVTDEIISKLLLVYIGSSRELLLYWNDSLVSSKIFSDASEAWSELRLSGSEGLELYELIIYNSSKANSEVAEIQTYLNNKWGF